MKDPRDFFPGDPPFGEWLVVFCAICGAVAGVVFMARTLRRGDGNARLGVASIALLLPFAWFLVARHSGPWRALQTKLVTFEAAARAALRGCKSNCDCAIRRLDESYGSTLFQFTPEYRPVRLIVRCRSDRPVAVDFGGGATAVFDPGSMITVYSD